MRTRTGLQLYPRDSAAEHFRTPRYQVDLSPDFVHQIIRDGIDPSRLEHLLISHPDGDHLHLDYLRFRSSILSPLDELPVLNIYGNQYVEEAILSEVQDLERIRCRFQRVEDGETFAVGELEVTAYLAEHRGPRCLHFAIDDGERTLLTAWDGLWEEETWARLATRQFDAVGMECTHLGESERDSSSHLTLRQFLAVRARMKECGMLREGSLHFAMHIGDNGGLTHDEAQALAGNEGFIVGYDGMLLDV